MFDRPTARGVAACLILAAVLGGSLFSVRVRAEPDHIVVAGSTTIIRPLRVNGVMGSIRSLRNGSYPINRPLFLFTRGWPRGRTFEFINYALDPDRGQRIIEDAGYIPLYNHNKH